MILNVREEVIDTSSKKEGKRSRKVSEQASPNRGKDSKRDKDK